MSTPSAQLQSALLAEERAVRRLARISRIDTTANKDRADGKGAHVVLRGGSDVFAARLPERLIYVMGAEAEGMNAELARACDLRVSIPGSGAVESLNVAAATAVLLAQWARRSVR